MFRIEMFYICFKTELIEKNLFRRQTEFTLRKLEKERKYSVVVYFNKEYINTLFLFYLIVSLYIYIISFLKISSYAKT